MATIAIAYFTLTLKQSTDKLWKAGEDQFRLAEHQFRLVSDTSARQAVEIQNQIDIARQANRAAQKSADAAVAVERARFYIVVKKHNLEDFLRLAGMFPNSPTMPFSFEPTIEYAFKNYGKTPGIISEVSHGMIVHRGPPDPVYVVSGHLFVENMIASGEFTEIQKFDGPVLFDRIDDAMPILAGEAHFWFYGRLDYEDVFGEPQVHRFLMRYVKNGLRVGLPTLRSQALQQEQLSRFDCALVGHLAADTIACDQITAQRSSGADRARLRWFRAWPGEVRDGRGPARRRPT